jgi:predicted nucleic-acid-binding protein
MRRQTKGGLLDTNVLVRFLLDDDPHQSPRAAALMKRLEQGNESACLEESVLAETVWVLEKGYGVPRLEIARLLSTIVELPGIRCRSRRGVLEALSRFSATPCDIIDCLLAACARSRGLTVYSFDQDFKRLGCAWAEPR